MGIKIHTFLTLALDAGSD